MRRVVAEIIWLVRLMEDLGVSISLPITVHSDSHVAIHITKNLIFHERTKHVELDCHFIRQQFLVGLIFLSFVSSLSQIADVFTKALPGSLHHSLIRKLEVGSHPSNLRGDVGI